MVNPFYTAWATYGKSTKLNIDNPMGHSLICNLVTPSAIILTPLVYSHGYPQGYP